MSMFKRETRSFMGDPAYNPFENPSMPLQSLALDGVLGSGRNNIAGENVDPVSGMTLPTVYRCISIISTVIAASDLQLINRDGEADVWPTWSNLVSYTPYEIAEIIVVHMASWGNFYGLKVTNGSGVLVDLQPIWPGNVSVKLVNGHKIFRVRKVQGIDGAVRDPLGDNNDMFVDYTEDDVLHIPFLGYDGLQGMSPISAAALTMGTAMAADGLAARFYSQGTQLSGVINVKVPLADQHAADSIKQAWRRANQGNRNAGNVAVLDSETSFQPITIPPNELQFLEARQWQKQEIATLYGIPLTLLSSESTGYGDAIEAQQEGLVTYTLRAYTDRIEQRLSREFTPRGSSVKFNLDGVLRGSTQDRYTAYNMAIAAGWQSRAEVRKAEGKPAAPTKNGNNLNDFLAPQSAGGQIELPAMTPNGEPAAGGQSPATPVSKHPQTAPEQPQNASEDRSDDLTAEEYLATLSPSELADFKAAGVEDPELDRLLEAYADSDFQKVDENGWTGNRV